MKELTIKVGDIITFDCLEWNDGWEFGKPADYSDR